jgi:hypothetical protein
MGADIYLKSIFEPFQAQYRPPTHECGEHPTTFMDRHYDELRKSGGYFRNGYNSGDVMWAMGLSWQGTVGPMLDENHCLPIARASELIEMIAGRPLTREHVVAHVFGDMGNDHPLTADILRTVDGIEQEVTGKAPPQRQVPTQQEIDDLVALLNVRRDQLLAILRK